jgi:hypothetical protein
MFNFHHHDFHFFSLCSRYFEFFFLHLFYLLFQNLSFSVYYFRCFLPNHCSFLNLLDKNLFSMDGCSLPSLFS